MKSLIRLLMPWKSTPQAQSGVEELLLRGNALEDRGDVLAACARYQEAVRLSPRHAKAHLNLGNAMVGLGRTGEALACYRRAIELQPDSLHAHLNIGSVLLSRQSVLQATDSYRTAVRLCPDSAEAWAGLGCALAESSAPDEALAAFAKALEIDPGHEGAASRLAPALRARGQARAALQVLDKALELKPTSAMLWPVLADLSGGVGDYATAARACRRQLELAPDDLGAYSGLLWMLNLDPDISAEEILAEHRRFGALMEPLSRILPPRDPDPGARRIRIGYVSPDFRRHSVSCFIEPVLRHHDRESFEVHCFYDHPSWDDVTDRLRALAERWHDIAGASDEDVAERIRANEIDILVDLAGHSACNRMRLFALKPAPLQFTWLGYLCTTGLRAMDYRLCDFHTDPEGVAERWQVERPARLPDSQWCYQPQVALPEPSALPMLENGYWMFGSFNQESKLSDPVLEAWSRVLEAIPDSRLRIVGITCDVVEERIRTCFAQHGIASERVELVGRIPIDAYLASYRDVDIALDSFPYNGATTTCDALLMGVPVAAVAGTRAIARGGVSLMSTIGLSDWIADSPENLAGLLQRHTRDAARLAQLRAELPQKMRASALMDAAHFTRNLESIFREAWQRACAESGNRS
jgi:predicted O-linked N-acetylglucosamine transferase (SPINDLY family)